MEELRRMVKDTVKSSLAEHELWYNLRQANADAHRRGYECEDDIQEKC